MGGRAAGRQLFLSLSSSLSLSLILGEEEGQKGRADVYRVWRRRWEDEGWRSGWKGKSGRDGRGVADPTTAVTLRPDAPHPDQTTPHAPLEGLRVLDQQIFLCIPLPQSNITPIKSKPRSFSFRKRTHKMFFLYAIYNCYNNRINV